MHTENTLIAVDPPRYLCCRSFVIDTERTLYPRDVEFVLLILR